MRNPCSNAIPYNQAPRKIWATTVSMKYRYTHYPLGNARRLNLSLVLHSNPTPEHCEQHGRMPSHRIFLLRHLSHAWAIRLCELDEPTFIIFIGKIPGILNVIFRPLSMLCCSTRSSESYLRLWRIGFGPFRGYRYAQRCYVQLIFSAIVGHLFNVTSSGFVINFNIRWEDQFANREQSGDSGDEMPVCDVLGIFHIARWRNIRSDKRVKGLHINVFEGN